MTILELLEAHSIAAFAGCDTLCACDRKWRTNIAWRAHLAEALEAHQKEREAQLHQLVRDMTDPDPCWFDHHGGCQAHGYLDLKPSELCPHAEAKQILKEQP